MKRPLEGCRVLDLGIITAGAATSALLADLGAEVIKLESPGYRDPFRQWIPGSAESDPDLPPFFRYTNRNKVGISLDLKRPEGRDAFLRLVGESDVVLENFRRGVLTRLGIDYPALSQVRGDIIFASLSSQGDTGPDANYVSYGTTLEAMSGLAWLTGYAGGGPVVSGKDLNYPDQVVAIFAAGMIASAWLHRQRTGLGAHLDISQRELTGFLVGEAFLEAGASQPRQGNAESGYALQACFLATDGIWLAVSVRQDQLPVLDNLVAASSAGGGLQQLAGWIAGRSCAEGVGQLVAAGIAAAAVLDGGQVLAERGAAWHFAIASLPNGDLVKGFPFQLRQAPLRTLCDAPRVGADTGSVLERIGGFSADEIRRLFESGVAESPIKTLARAAATS